MDVTLRRYFRHPHTLAMFGRYATYVGASPDRAPSIFNMMAHVETGLGVFGVRGGTYSIVEAFVRLAQELGVEISLSTEASRIRVRNGRAVGVETADGDFAEADTVIVNADALAAVQRLLPEHERPSSPGRKLEQLEPSVAGFVLLAGVERDYPDLLHHNVFFPERYSREFVDLFDHRVLPEEPAIYVCRSGGAEGAGHAGGFSGSAHPQTARTSLFILVNAPARRPGYSVSDIREAYAERILKRLEEAGLTGLKSAAASPGRLPPRSDTR